MFRRLSLAVSVIALGGMIVGGIVTAPIASAATTGSISGTLRYLGSPLTNVCVLVISTTAGTVATATSAGDGTYTVGPLSADSYVVGFDPTCRGTHSSPAATQYYNDAADFGEATPLALGAGVSMTGIDATLVAGATLSGTVTANSAGVANVCVTAYSSSFGFAIGGGTTGAGGTYTISNLPPTTYRVGFDPTCGYSQTSPYAMQFYSGQADFGAATGANQIVLSAGTTQTNVNAAVVAGGSITGTVSAPAAASAGGICVIAESSSQGYLVGLAVTAADGTYDVTNLPADSYAVKFDPSCEGLQATDFATRWYSGSSTFSAANAFSLAAGATQANINGTIPLQVTSLSISTGSLSSGSVSSSYSAAVRAGGGTGPYVWVASGLPTGLAINAGTGVISGTPANPGIYTVSVTATDSSTPPVAAHASFSLTISRIEKVCSGKTVKVAVRTVEVKKGKKVVVITHKAVPVYTTITVRRTEKIHGKKVVVVTHKREQIKVCKTIRVT